MMTNNQRLLAQKDELIHKLSWNSAMGCYTRKGLEHVIWPEKAATTRFLIYFDVNGVHDINETAGTYDAFDAMIKQVLSIVRSTDAAAGQWNSGDEFLICMIESDDRNEMDPQGLVVRLIAEMGKQGLSAIFAIGEVKSTDLYENVKPLSDKVLAAKKARGVGR